VLEEIGAAQSPILEVYNKIDIAGTGYSTQQDALGDVVLVGTSAISSEASSELIDAIGQRLGVGQVVVPVLLAASAGRVRSWLYDIGAVVDEQVEPDGKLALNVRVNKTGYARLQQEAGVMLQNSGTQ
jgi:GTP-binding protein HflX